MCDFLTFLLSPLLMTGSPPEIWPDTVREQISRLVDSYAVTIGLSNTDLRLLFPLTLANWLRSQLNDGHRGFAEKLYRLVNLYFEDTGLWETAILPSSVTGLVSRNSPGLA